MRTALSSLEQPLADSQKGHRSFNPMLQETKSYYNNMSLEEDIELQIRMVFGQYLVFILVRYWAENLVMLCQTSDLTELWADKWVLFEATRFVVKYYAAIEN